MSESLSDRRSDRSAGDAREGDPAVDELRAEVARLAAENERLRTAYARSKRTAYRKSAAALAVLGLVAVAGGFALPQARQVLLVLGAIGLFGAVLTAYLTPERFVAASVGRAVYGALADNEAALAAELGLGEDRHYVPTGPGRGVRLFVPQAGTDGLPAPADLETTLVATEDAVGIALDPSGADLLREFEASLAGDLPGSPVGLTSQLAEALAEQFELVRTATPNVDEADGRATIAVGDSAYGRVDRFDHPVASFLAAGLARGLGRPIELDVTDGEDGWLVTCRWEPEDVAPEARQAADASGADEAADRVPDAAATVQGDGQPDDASGVTSEAAAADVAPESRVSEADIGESAVASDDAGEESAESDVGEDSDAVAADETTGSGGGTETDRDGTDENRDEPSPSADATRDDEDEATETRDDSQATDDDTPGAPDDVAAGGAGLDDLLEDEIEEVEPPDRDSRDG